MSLTKTQAAIQDVCDELKALLLRKNKDYGDSAFKSPILTPGISPAVAQRIRMSDKIERLTNLLSRETDPAVADESLIDTFLDLAGYSILQVIELRRQQQPASLPKDPVDSSPTKFFYFNETPVRRSEISWGQRQSTSDCSKSTNATYLPEE